jgi:hypothetical protein
MAADTFVQEARKEIQGLWDNKHQLVQGIANVKKLCTPVCRIKETAIHCALKKGFSTCVHKNIQ